MPNTYKDINKTATVEPWFIEWLQIIVDRIAIAKLFIYFW